MELCIFRKRQTYLQYAVSLGFRDVVVQMPDMDIFVILLHYALSLAINILVDMGTGKNRCLVDVTMLAKFLGSNNATTVMGLYTFTVMIAMLYSRAKGR